MPVHPEDLAARNRRLSVAFLAGGALFAALLGYGLGILSGLGWFAAVLAVGFASASVATSYLASDRIVLAATGARVADPATYRRYHNLVEGLSIAAGMPKPRLYVVDSPALNAFATGRSPDHAAIAVTSGLLETMSRVELQGVLAHELAHVKNLDIRLLAVVTVVVGTIVLLADWMLRSFAYGGPMRNRGRGGDQTVPVLAILAVLAAVLAPIAAQLLRFAVSRQREYLADADGVLLTRYPPGLAGALRKIAGDTTPLRQASAGNAHLWLNDPIPARARSDQRGGRWGSLLATHPPISDRIRRLEAL